MNSAAVIGRQLRQQQNTGRSSGQSVPQTPGGRGRPRTPSHQSLYPPQLSGQNASQLNSSVSGSGGAFGPGQGPGQEKKKKPSTWEVVRSKVSLRCICHACKALSGGFLLILIGTGMSVIGFYAETFATETVKEGNRTVEYLDEERQYHLHNLTYVGPALMGLGGLALVAACVMTFEVKDTAGSKVAPEADKEHHELLGERPPGSLLMGGASLEKLNGPSIFLQNSSPYLRVPQLSPILHHAGSSEFGSGRDDEEEEEEDVMSETITIQLIPNGPASKPTLHDLPLFMTRSVSPPTTIPPSCSSSSGYGAATTTDRNCVGNNSSSSAGGVLLSPAIDDYMPSPQDLEISDPDGCSTPRRASLTSMDMELYLSDCPITVRVQVEPKHFASMESDGLSDSDNSEHAGADGRDLGGDFGSVSLDRDLDDVELELPLLGRCSPQLPFLPHLHNPRHYHSSRTSAETPLLKRDSSNGGRRFPLMRQSAMEAGHLSGTRNHDGRGNHDCRT